MYAVVVSGVGEEIVEFYFVGLNGFVTQCGGSVVVRSGLGAIFDIKFTILGKLNGCRNGGVGRSSEDDVWALGGCQCLKENDDNC